MNSAPAHSVKWVCSRQLARVRSLFDALNLDHDSLGAVKAGAAAEDWPRACSALLDYYAEGESVQRLRHAAVPPGVGTVPAAEGLARDTYVINSETVRVPRLPGGGIDWAYPGPRGEDPDWGHNLTKHFHMHDLLKAYFDTGNRDYARCIDAQIRDWASVAERPEGPGWACPWGNNLDVGERGKVWPAIFYGLQNEPEFTPAARLLMLCQVLDHALYLRALHSRGSNWVITEMAGLLCIACAWPEFRDASEWREHSLQVAQEELNKQVYPDGTLKELTSNYQYAVLLHMSFFVATMRGAGIPMPSGLQKLLEDMWNYLAYTLAPNGYPPHNSDSDRCSPSGESELIEPLLQAADVYRRPDWIYIATNGARGDQPQGLPSILFPWAGQLISRSGWDAEAHWAFFDIGPWGTLHQHNDALHLSVTAYGRDLLVDSGRYTYINYWGELGATWRSYFIGSQAHNVILVDGLGQQPGPTTAERPLEDDRVIVTPDYDYARGIFANGFTDVETASASHKAIMSGQDLGCTGIETGVTHTRAVLYLRGRCWVVVDRIETDRPRRITALWHFHPDCTVVCEGQSVVTVDEGVGNLRIQPIGDLAWEIELVSGREGPDFQGWYSTEFNVLEPATCALYRTDIDGARTFVWVLLPARAIPPMAAVTRRDICAAVVELEVRLAHEAPWTVKVDLENGDVAIQKRRHNEQFRVSTALHQE